MKLPLPSLALAAISTGHVVAAFAPSPKASLARLLMFFADEASDPTEKETPALPLPPTGTINTDVNLISSDQPGFLNLVGSFLVDAFWLASDHHQISSQAPDEKARLGLVVEQCADLQEKYGEVMGRRLLPACVIGAFDDSKNLLGVVSLKATLMIRDDVLEAEKAELVAKNAIASLGPKQRRLYKDASIQIVAEELLNADTKAVVVLSNLAVSPNARRQGIGQTLCDEAEALASEWEFRKIHLLVEQDNQVALELYQGKLGYSIESIQENAPALRADIHEGGFQEITANTLILSKDV